MTVRADVAVDAGTVMTRIAVARPGSEPAISSLPSARAGRGSFVADVLREAIGGLNGSAGRACVAVPDSWLDGDVGGAAAHEAMRHAVEYDIGRAITWVGQMSAVAALAAEDPELAGSGECLVCDVGGTGVRAGLFDISGRIVRPICVAGSDGGGWADLDAAIRSAPGMDADELPADWFASARHQRAGLLLKQAKADPGYRDAPVYSFPGRDGVRDVTAGWLLDHFEPAVKRIRALIADVVGQHSPATAVLAGGMATFPPVAEVVADGAGVAPAVLGADAAVRGALSVASGTVTLQEILLPPVSLPAHEVRGGLLVERRLPLPWPAPPEGDAEVPLVLADQALTVDVDGALQTVHLPDFAPGPYRIRIRPGGHGRALLVLRPDFGAGQPALICPFDLER